MCMSIFIRLISIDFKTRNRERPVLSFIYNLSETNLGYVHTGPVPNGSGLKIVTDRPFVHMRPANRTVNPFPIRSDN